MDTTERNARAASAERAILDRYLGGFPGVSWGRSAWPPIPLHRRGGPARWHYWWSAHLLDAAVDAAAHRPSPSRRRRARRLVRGIRLRNGGTLSRTFYDDLAWMGLALEHDGGHRRATERIAAQLQGAVDPAVGAVPWEVGNPFFNAPANGPAAILFARTGRRDAAARLSDWMDETLRDPSSGLIIDGVVIERGVETRRATELYTYCQGVALGAAAALAADDARFASRAASLVGAIAAWTGPSLLLPGAGGGDRGLFAGIACRYLTEAASALHARAESGEPDAAPLERAAASARSLVIANADALWGGRATIDGLPVFSADAKTPADPTPDAPERDLSVQLGAWLTLEAAVSLG